MDIDAGPIGARPSSSTSFTDTLPSGSSETNSSFCGERIGNQLSEPESKCSSSAGSIQCGVGILGSVCASTVNFKSPAIIQHSGNRASDDSHSYDLFFKGNPDAKFRPWNWLVMPMMLAYELIRFGQRQRDNLKRFHVAIILSVLTLPLAAQTPVCSTPTFPAALSTNRNLLIAADNIQTTLTTIQLVSDTTANVHSGTGWLPNMMATVGLEQELVTAVSGNVLTVVRGQAGTQAIQHPATSLISNFIDACYNNIKTAEIIAIETALGTNLSNVIGALPYVTQALVPNGQVITAGTHGQGLQAEASCYSGPVIVVLGKNVQSGEKVYCNPSNDGHGNLTVKWIAGTVSSLLVSAQGRGPLGLQGASGLGASPYVVNSTTSGQSITVGTHGQGPNVTVGCWSGPLVVVAGISGISGIPATCVPTLDGAGNISSITWSGTDVGSIIVSASGTPAPFTINSSANPMSLPQATHQKGINPAVDCWSGILSGSAVSGTKVTCEVDNDGSGNLTIIYAGLEVGSVRVQ